MMGLELHGKPTCLYIDETMMIDGNYYPGIVQFHEPGYSRTNWNYGPDLAKAKAVVDSINKDSGWSQGAVTLIVATSMFPKSTITREHLEQANRECD